jgi:hypothetical protein
MSWSDLGSALEYILVRCSHSQSYIFSGINSWIARNTVSINNAMVSRRRGRLDRDPPSLETDKLIRVATLPAGDGVYVTEKAKD